MNLIMCFLFFRETSSHDVDRDNASNRHADINTPMLVAERFRELYNNEWAEAFAVLRAKNVNKRKAMQLLLLIVEVSTSTFIKFVYLF